MKLHALINLYNDRQFLAACLESIHDQVDRIVIADGAYKLYYQEYHAHDSSAKPYSTDGSLEIIKGFQDLPELYMVPRPYNICPHDTVEECEAQGCECWNNQIEKRTALIDAVPLDDWFIIIDADEMLMGDIQEGMEQIYDSGCIVASTPLWIPGTDVDRLRREWHPRVFKKQKGMHYDGTHWHLRDKYDRIIEEKYPVFWTDLMVFIHFKPFKSQSRIIPHQNYMAELANRGWLEPTDLGKVLMSGITRTEEKE